MLPWRERERERVKQASPCSPRSFSHGSRNGFAAVDSTCVALAATARGPISRPGREVKTLAAALCPRSYVARAIRTSSPLTVAVARLTDGRPSLGSLHTADLHHMSHPADAFAAVYGEREKQRFVSIT